MSCALRHVRIFSLFAYVTLHTLLLDSRQAIIERLEQEEELVEAEVPQSVEKKVEAEKEEVGND